jgi:hypothetical protein
MSEPVDLNAALAQFFDDWHTMLMNANAAWLDIKTAAEDADALIKDVHLHWPLAIKEP